MTNITGTLRRVWRSVVASLRIRERLRNSRFVVYLALQVVLLSAGAVVTTLGPVGVAIGTSMIAAALGGMIVFGWVVFDEREQARRLVIEDFGFETAFRSRSMQIKDEYISRISAAHRNIDIMGFGLNALREDFLDDFHSWAGRARVRILLVDPAAGGDPSYADQRDSEEGSPTGKIRSEVELFVRETAALEADLEADFQVRLSKALPSVNMFRVDNEIFWGPYLVSSLRQGKTSRNLPTMVVRCPGYMFDRLVDHFDEIWSNEQLSRKPDVP